MASLIAVRRNMRRRHEDRLRSWISNVGWTVTMDTDVWLEMRRKLRINQSIISQKVQKVLDCDMISVIWIICLCLFELNLFFLFSDIVFQSFDMISRSPSFFTSTLQHVSVRHAGATCPVESGGQGRSHSPELTWRHKIITSLHRVLSFTAK